MKHEISRIKELMKSHNNWIFTYFSALALSCNGMKILKNRDHSVLKEQIQRDFGVSDTGEERKKYEEKNPGIVLNLEEELINKQINKYYLITSMTEIEN